MRNNLPLSLAVWATAALTALSFAACAKSVNSDLNDSPSGTGDAGNGANTQPASSGSGGSSSGGNPGGSGGEDSGGSANDDSGSTSNGEDSGDTTPTDSGGSSGGQDSGGNAPTGGGAQPQSICPTTSYYETEFENVSPFSATICESGSDCSTAQCCYYIAFLGDGYCVGL
jgi:hypothetical protein